MTPTKWGCDGFCIYFQAGYKTGWLWKHQPAKTASGFDQATLIRRVLPRGAESTAPYSVEQTWMTLSFPGN
ncbi:MAG: hypothetical protein ABFC97_05955 [Anaerolineaceae bacterium]